MLVIKFFQIKIAANTVLATSACSTTCMLYSPCNIRPLRCHTLKVARVFAAFLICKKLMARFLKECNCQYGILARRQQEQAIAEGRWLSRQQLSLGGTHQGADLLNPGALMIASAGHGTDQIHICVRITKAPCAIHDAVGLCTTYHPQTASCQEKSL